MLHMNDVGIVYLSNNIFYLGVFKEFKKAALYLE